MSDEPDYLGMLARAGVAGAAAAAGLIVSGPAGGMIGSAASQLAVDVTVAMADKLGERRRQRTAIPIEHAAQRLSLPLADVTRRLTNEPGLEQLTTTVLVGALSTVWEEKFLFLGRVLANVLQDRATLDEEQFLAQAVTAIEPPHLRLLELIERQQTASGRLVSQYALAGAELGAAFSAVLKTLESVGLIEGSQIMEMRDGPRPRYPKPGAEPPQVPVATPHWAATELGKLLLTRLRAVSDDAAGAGVPERSTTWVAHVQARARWCVSVGIPSGTAGNCASAGVVRFRLCRRAVVPRDVFPVVIRPLAGSHGYIARLSRLSIAFSATLQTRSGVILSR